MLICLSDMHRDLDVFFAEMRPKRLFSSSIFLYHIYEGYIIMIIFCSYWLQFVVIFIKWADHSFAPHIRLHASSKNILKPVTQMPSYNMSAVNGDRVIHGYLDIYYFLRSLARLQPLIALYQHSIHAEFYSHNLCNRKLDL